MTPRPVDQAAFASSIRRATSARRLAQVLDELADAFGELLGRHGVLVEGETERLLVELDRGGRIVRGVGREPARQVALRGREFVEESGRDREPVAAGERLDLARHCGRRRPSPPS